MQEKGLFLYRECITRRQLLKFSAPRANFQQFCSKEGKFWQDLQGKQHVFYQKNCKRKGVFFQKIARERVQFRRPCWHTRVQKLGKCPPGVSWHTLCSMLPKLLSSAPCSLVVFASCSWLPGCFEPHSPGSLKPLMGSQQRAIQIWDKQESLPPGGGALS